MPASIRTIRERRRNESMRKISDWIDSHREQERKLLIPFGTIGVGGADFDHLLKATVGEAYLRVLRKGGTPDEAHAEAIIDGDYCVKVWNDRTSKGRVCVNGPYELKRWDGAGRSAADDLHVWFSNMTSGTT